MKLVRNFKANIKSFLWLFKEKNRINKVSISLIDNESGNKKLTNQFNRDFASAFTISNKQKIVINGNWKRRRNVREFQEQHIGPRS